MEISTHITFTDESSVSKIDAMSLERESDSSDDNIIVRGRGTKQSRGNLRDSDSDVENDISYSTKSSLQNNSTKSRIRKICDSDSDSPSPSQESPIAVSRVSRVENKRKNLHDKFKKLVTSQSKTSVDSDIENQPQISENDSEKSNGEISCLKIKKKIMKKKSSLSTICDADTSDDEVDSKVIMKKQRKQKTKPKSAIEIPPQPRMSAKQAMENMQKIKSESNRMLREKDVSLPYHKPRALSLQDIMNRKKPTLMSDGKAMPIKMNSEQLAQYAKLLEERQKEMIELCKSESEEEPDPEGTMNIEHEKIKEGKNDEIQNISKISDAHFDEIVQENNDYTENNINIAIETGVLIEDKNDSEKSSNSEEISLENNLVSEENNIFKETDIVNDTNCDSKKLYEKENDASKQTNMNDKTKTDSLNKIENPLLNSENSDHNSINVDSQLITLKFDSEKTENDELECTNKETVGNSLVKYDGIDPITKELSDTISNEKAVCNEFSDDENDFNLEDIDNLIENAEIIKDSTDTCTTNAITTTSQAKMKPKLTGTPGMVIDLETGDQMSNILTGVDLLKERFTYFSQLKSVEDMEKNRLTKYKPGTQHLKLKHELEERIAEQRSLEWEKRLQEERQLKSEMDVEPIEEIEEIEAKLEEDKEEENSSSEDDDLVEDDVDMTDKPRKSNPMVDHEAEESNEEENNGNNIEEGIADDEELDDIASNDDDDNSSSDDTTSESEDEQKKDEKKKGRILKAFEDSDDESNIITQDKPTTQVPLEAENAPSQKDVNDVQDEEIQLAQLNRSVSEDIFATQGSVEVAQGVVADYNKDTDDIPCTADLGSQTFSIMDSTTLNKEKLLNMEENLSATQSIDETKFESFNIVCPGSLSQNLFMSQPRDPQSQELGDDIAALCTGKFYDNQFVTQTQNNLINTTEEQEQKIYKDESNNKVTPELSLETVRKQDTELNEKVTDNKVEKIKPTEDGNILKSILDELNEPEIEKTNKFFVASKDHSIKKRFIIDSDDESHEGDNNERNKKLKKRKPEKRALQISDDEEDEEIEDEEEQESDIEQEMDTMVEYDSEENEVEIKEKPKKKRIGEFFENEAELSSEGEWAGSGDEDEGGLDRLEREAGDDDVFHQGRLQRELGQIHMREVLDQDKREVRLLQELLFEDGDLGDGRRQRKFRWRTEDGDDETGMGPINLLDTQEEEFESEELWRKQRHEREVFLRSMQENGDAEKPASTLNRTAMIKANLNASSASNVPKHEIKDKTEAEPLPQVEAKISKNIPSPKKSFLILKQSYHGSLLSRGRGALARLAALATPLAAEADAPRLKAASGAAGNFVFATLSQPDPEPKVAKRKAQSNAGTPRLLKKMKTEETQKYLKNSLFDHFKT